MTELTPEILLQAYAKGLFPMAEDRNDPRLFWVDPDVRGIIPLETFHVPRRLLRKVRQDLFEVRTDSAFLTVIEACATPAPGRWTTWINDEIVALYTGLHAMDHAHSVRMLARGPPARRPLRRVAGRRVLRRKHVQLRDRRQQKSPWCILSPGLNTAATGCSTHSS